MTTKAPAATPEQIEVLRKAHKALHAAWFANPLDETVRRACVDALALLNAALRGEA